MPCSTHLTPCSAGFALPPSAPAPTLSPALLDGLKPAPPPTVTNTQLLGTMVLQQVGGKRSRPLNQLAPNPYATVLGSSVKSSIPVLLMHELYCIGALRAILQPQDLKPFSSSTRLPHQTTAGGAGGDSAASLASSSFLLVPVDVSMSEAYTYNVRSYRSTGIDLQSPAPALHDILGPD